MDKLKTTYMESKKNSTCYGCSICAKVCPVSAISMVKNTQGFLYPLVDEDKCIDCGKCQAVCPYSISKPIKIGVFFQVAHKEKAVLRRSQCGGAFTAISDFSLRKGGVVYGAAFADDFSVAHIRATDKVGRDKMNGSKYVQSVITTELICQLEEDIGSGRIVVFSGTPCQCAMVKKNYGENENLYICDFICHGVPSPALWKKYLKYIEHENHEPIISAVFRNKRCRKIGNYTESYYFASGTEKFYNDYGALFYSHLAHRESCFACQFTTQKRYSDITIGGFLEPSDFDAPYDSSMVIVNSSKGEELFEAIKQDIEFQKSNVTYYKNQPCLYHPVGRPENYEQFWKDFSNKDMHYLIKQYAIDEIKDKYKIRILSPGEDYDAQTSLHSERPLE